MTRADAIQLVRGALPIRLGVSVEVDEFRGVVLLYVRLHWLWWLALGLAHRAVRSALPEAEEELKRCAPLCVVLTVGMSP